MAFLTNFVYELALSNHQLPHILQRNSSFTLTKLNLLPLQILTPLKKHLYNLLNYTSAQKAFAGAKKTFPRTHLTAPLHV